MSDNNTMKITIRESNEEDYSAILSLIKELASFVKAPEKVTNSVAQMKKEKEFFKCIVATNERSEILGIATYFFSYYTWVGKSLYLDDLYVKKEYRGLKIGTKLLKTILDIVKKENCKRFRIEALIWNKNAVSFYKKLGAEVDNEVCNCDFDEEAIMKVKI
jgi:GNAT superfamily N-acetyltransferase